MNKETKVCLPTAKSVKKLNAEISRIALSENPQVHDIVSEKIGMNGKQYYRASYIAEHWNTWMVIHPDSITGWFADFIKRHELPKVTIH